MLRWVSSKLQWGCVNWILGGESPFSHVISIRWRKICTWAWWIHAAAVMAVGPRRGLNLRGNNRPILEKTKKTGIPPDDIFTYRCPSCNGTGMETVSTGPFMMRSTCRWFFKCSRFWCWNSDADAWFLHQRLDQAMPRQGHVEQKPLLPVQWSWPG